MKNSLNWKLLSGPVAFAAGIVALQSTFGFKGAVAVATTLWMALWWIFRPVHIAVTSFVPIMVNAFFNLIPNSHVISQYFSEIVVLLLGADLICLTWTTTGLDKRISVRTLCYIGTSMKQQIFVWFAASTVLSIMLPNVVVATIMCPIAVAMLKFVGEEEIGTSKLAVPIMLAIGWGSGIGGFGSPIGSSANLVAVSYLETMIGHEFMYFEWIIRFVPMLVIVFAVNLLFIWNIKIPVRELKGTKAFFEEMYAKFGPMKKGEKIGLLLFALATLLAFIRPLYAGLLPALKPAYAFLTLGMLMFVLKDENDQPMLTWKQAESNVMWGMMFLFASGMALGRMVIETGAVERLSQLVAALQLEGGLGTMLIFCAFACLLTEISSNTAAASIAIPVVTGICKGISLNPIPFVLATIVAANCAYVLPVSTRAIPVAFGLNAGVQVREGIKLTLITAIVVTCCAYGFMKFWPLFSNL